MIDVEGLKAQVDLLAVTERDTNLKRVASTAGGEWAGPCPFCGGHDRFRVQPSAPGGGRWLCRSCTGSRWHDVVDYIQRRESCDFLAALNVLGGQNHPVPRAADAPTPAKLSPSCPPDSRWQESARRITDDCGEILWSSKGAPAQAWLHSRGLSDDTLRKWQIGYNPGIGAGRTVAGLHLPYGIVIPGIVDETIWNVKIRRPVGEPKYLNVKGGRPGLFGANTLVGHDVAVLCEGEFDAMLLEQECGDLVGVATLGSASGRLDVKNWAKYLLPICRLLIAYDVDAAGHQGTSNLMQLTARARRIRVPTVLPKDKDITDYHKAGGRLHDWLLFEMERLGISVTSQAVDQNEMILNANDCFPSLETPASLLAPRESVADELRAEQRLYELFDRWEAAENPYDMEWVRAWAEASIAAGMPCYHGGTQDLGAEGWRKWAADYEVNSS